MAPSRWMVRALALWAALGLIVSIWPALRLGWIVVGVGLLGWLGLDVLLVRRLPVPTVERRVAAALALGVESEVHLRLRGTGTRPVRAELFDDHPDGVEVTGLPQPVVIPVEGEWVELKYTLRPLRRGALRFGATELQLRSPLGGWTRRLVVGEATAVRVYPNFAAVARYALLAVANRTDQMGIRRQQRRGEGLEFHQLREYRVGDALRQIDGPATARTQKLISRDYQESRDQQILFLLDCGRRMRAQDDALSHFDHALNALLLLAHVALRQGDAVGLTTFGGEEERFMAPRKGDLTAVINQIYDLEPSPLAPDYLTAATRLMARQRRRALVVLITNLRDEDADELKPALALLRSRHLTLVASLRESAVERVLTEPIGDLPDALRVAAVHDYLAERRRAHEALSGLGALVVDVEPPQLAAALVNRYLDLKRSGQL